MEKYFFVIDVTNCITQYELVNVRQLARSNGPSVWLPRRFINKMRILDLLLIHKPAADHAGLCCGKKNMI